MRTNEGKIIRGTLCEDNQLELTTIHNIPSCRRLYQRLNNDCFTKTKVATAEY